MKTLNEIIESLSNRPYEWRGPVVGVLFHSSGLSIAKSGWCQYMIPVRFEASTWDQFRIWWAVINRRGVPVHGSPTPKFKAPDENIVKQAMRNAE